jgi:hypothetical protein
MRTIIMIAMLWVAAFAGRALAGDTKSTLPQPVDLTKAYNDTADKLTNMTGFVAWKGCLFGHQVFHGVPFQIDGLIYLWGNGPSGNGSSGFPEIVPDIAVNRKFPSLYVCHGSYYKSPDDTPVVKVVFHYEDGSSFTNTLLFGDDILDWKVSGHEAPLRTPSGTNSSLAWIGGEFSPKEKTPLRYCMTALDNPHPDQAVVTIDLISCKTRTVPFILGMTTGPAGLIK